MTATKEFPPEHFAKAVEMRGLLLGRLVTAAIGAAARLRLPDLIAGGAHTVDDLVEACGAEPDALDRLLRALIAVGLLTRRCGATFDLTPLGHTLRSDVPGTAWPSALLASGEMGQAWDGLLDTVRTGQPAFDKVFGTDLFDYLAHQPELQATFYASQAADLETMLAGLADLDFSGYRTIVDVGGGDGALLAHLLRRCPQARGVLFEQDSMVGAARQRLAGAGLADRSEVVAGDLFDEVPGGGDLYVMRDVLHDWSDDRCVDLLRVCRRAMPPGAVLMVLERISSGQYDRQTALMDLYMLSVLTGQERTLGHYRKLLWAAELRPVWVHRLPAGATVITAEAA